MGFSFPQHSAMILSRSILVTVWAVILFVHMVYGEEFAYTPGPKGPSNWGGICETGTQQSPIDIAKSNIIEENSLKKLATNYSTAVGNLHLKEKTSQLDIEADDDIIGFGTLTVDKNQLIEPSGQNQGAALDDADNTYTLRKFHFHAPSEHMIDGESFPLELHLVHLTPSGKIAVIGILFKDGAENKFLDQVWKALPNMSQSPKVPIDLSVLPLASSYARYKGSLTTPNCTEPVNWIVLLNDEITISSGQLAEFKKYFPDANNRAVQLLNGRKIVMYGTFPSLSGDQTSGSSILSFRADHESFWAALLLHGLIVISLLSVW